MAVYFCDACGEGYDDDYNACQESPGNGEPVCENCFTQLEGELIEAEEKEYNSDDKLDFEERIKEYEA